MNGKGLTVVGIMFFLIIGAWSYAYTKTDKVQHRLDLEEVKDDHGADMRRIEHTFNKFDVKLDKIYDLLQSHLRGKHDKACE